MFADNTRETRPLDLQELHGSQQKVVQGLTRCFTRTG